ncbi:U4/U6-U5 snRNP complex subunit lsm8 [Coemansia sp. RSA 2524]|nr:U4/U6-U5 snRNP complex subunit lsm8 [Coemansia sp. RSA 2524]
MSQLQPYVNHKVSVIMNDGRIVGSQERIFSEDEGVEVVDLGLYLIRGDNIAVIGLVDEELDGALDLENLKGEPLPSLKH